MKKNKTIEEQQATMKQCQSCGGWGGYKKRCPSCSAVFEVAELSPHILIKALMEKSPDALPKADKMLQRTCDDLVKINKQLKSDRDFLEDRVDKLQHDVVLYKNKLAHPEKTDRVYDLPRQEECLQYKQMCAGLKYKCAELEAKLNMCSDVINQKKIDVPNLKEDMPAYNDSCAEWYNDSKMFL